MKENNKDCSSLSNLMNINLNSTNKKLNLDWIVSESKNTFIFSKNKKSLDLNRDR